MSNMVIPEFKEKTVFFFHNIGGKSSEDIETIAKEYISNVFGENEISAKIIDIAIYGSRSRGKETESSDIDIVAEIRSNLKEYALFNLLNESKPEIEGIRLDINPIRAEETGTLEKYLSNINNSAGSQQAVSILKQKGRRGK